MLIAIGERTNATHWSEGVLASIVAKWRDDPLHAMMCEEALPVGSVGRSRLSHLMGIHPDGCMNLLPPSKVVGSWDKRQAAKNAAILLRFFSAVDSDVPAHAYRLLLLGRRVAAAFGSSPKHPFGSIISRCGIKCLVLPHPSGRSRFLNNEANRGNVRAWVAEFARGERDGEDESGTAGR